VSRDALPNGDAVWVEGMAFEAYGVRVGVRLDEPTLLPDFLDRVPYGARVIGEPEPAVDHLFSFQLHGPDGHPVVYRNESEWVTSSHEEDLPGLIGMVAVGMKAFVTENAPDHVFAHAGVVAWHGRAILIPGESYSGKTTLVAELVRRGAEYYSDDYAVLDQCGLVHPYAQRLRLRLPQQVERDGKTPEELGGVAGERPVRVGLVVACPYVEGAIWKPRRLSLAEGLAVLLHNTRAAYTRPERVLEVLQHATEGAVFLAGPRGEAEIAAQEILDVAGHTAQ
jgi:hypothetical protein